MLIKHFYLNNRINCLSLSLQKSLINTLSIWAEKHTWWIISFSFIFFCYSDNNTRLYLMFCITKHALGGEIMFEKILCSYFIFVGFFFSFYIFINIILTLRNTILSWRMGKNRRKCQISSGRGRVFEDTCHRLYIRKIGKGKKKR